MPDWFCLYTRSQAEHAVAKELTLRQVENYLPCFKTAHRWADRTRILERPVFTGYLFVRYSAAGSELWPPARLRTVLSIPGAVRLIGSVPESEIEAIRILVLHPEAKPVKALPIRGTRVRVRCGPLTGLEGISQRIKGHCRVVVTIGLLGEGMAVEVGIDDVDVLTTSSRQVA